MYVVVGLGNPGARYRNTYHNIGFMTADALAKKCKLRFTGKECAALTAKGKIGGVPFVLAKPQTFMNLSGEALGEFSSFYKIAPEHIIIINDDVSLPAGKIRIRRKGSAGGHNGLKSIIYRLNTDEFVRIKMGVGAPQHAEHGLADYVLGRFLKEEIPVLEDAIIRAKKAVEEIIENGVDSAMNKYN